MASRPLPPGRRGRGPRVASGLHNLPEVKLLDVPETPTATPAAHASSIAAESHAPALTEIEKPTLSFEPATVPQHAAVRSQTSVAMASAASAAPAYTAAPSPAVIAASVKPVVAEQPAPVVKPKPRREEQASAHQFQSPHAPTAVAPPVPMRSPSIKAPAVTPAPVAKPIPSPPAAVPAVTTPASTLRAPAPQSDGATTADLGEFHPFYLLLPVDAVPQVPERIECIYDEAAVEMQKNVLKVVKKLLGRDKMRLEDFKINSRLFGNNFMEPYEYLESLVKDFGGVRALQLVPCLLVIQADFMRRSGLLLAAKNYRARHLASLETECQALRAVEVASVPAPQSAAPPSQPLPVAAAVAVDSRAVDVAVEDNDGPREDDKFVEKTVVPVSLPEEVAPEQKAELGLFAALVGSEAVATVTEVAHSAEKPDKGGSFEASTVAAAASSSDAISASPERHVVEEAEVAEAQETPVLQAEEVPSSAASVWTEPHVEIESDVAQPANEPESSQKIVEAPIEVVPSPVAIEPKAPEPAETKPAQVDEVAHKFVLSSRADAESDSAMDMLPAAFRQAFASYDSEPVVAKPASDVHITETTSKTHKADVEPASMSSTLSNRSSFAEAENLFGERMSTGSTSSDNAENLFGESMFQPAVAAPTAASAAETAATPASVPTPKREHSQLLFGFATAGADTDSDSDSDDSGFSSP